MIKRLLRKLRRPVPPVVVKCKHVFRDGLFTGNNDHVLQDPDFLAAYARGVEASHGVDSGIHWRVHVALWAAATAVRVPGDFVECGVNAGFVSSAIMHRLEWKDVPKRFYLIDTFRGPITAQYSSEEVKAGRLKLAEKAIASGGYVTDMDRVRKKLRGVAKRRCYSGCGSRNIAGSSGRSGGVPAHRYELRLPGKGGTGVFLVPFIAGRHRALRRLFIFRLRASGRGH